MMNELEALKWQAMQALLNNGSCASWAMPNSNFEQRAQAAARQVERATPEDLRGIIGGW